jgi:hypothetical protein
MKCSGLIFFMLLMTKPLFCQDMLQKEIALHVTDLPVKDVLDEISNTNGIYFTYAGNLEHLDTRISLNIEKISLRQLLNDLFQNYGIIYSTYANQVILKKRSIPEKIQVIQGMVLSAGDRQPVEYATLQLKHSKKGFVTGVDGKFSYPLSGDIENDTIIFYSIGFEPQVFSIKYLTNLSNHTIFLTPHPKELMPVELVTPRAKIIKEGNRGFSFGSLYLDTHGQQAALYIENPKKIHGRMKSVSFYLSRKGNTEAPFRIRIYARNDSLGCPDVEILPDMIIVKPTTGRGWTTTDIARYNIRFPENGIFIAVEGIYPGDYQKYVSLTTKENPENMEADDEFISGSLDYGQRLGYNRFTKNNTWHLSVANTWFQLDKRYFNIMISSEIIVYDPPKTKHQTP